MTGAQRFTRDHSQYRLGHLPSRWFCHSRSGGVGSLRRSREIGSVAWFVVGLFFVAVAGWGHCNVVIDGMDLSQPIRLSNSGRSAHADLFQTNR